MTRDIILFHPYENTSNTYIERMREIYSKNRNVKSFTTFLRTHPLSGREVKAVVFNWVESSPIYHFVLFLIWTKVFGIKIIWTFHNKLPHESSSNILANIKMYSMELLSNKIVLHSKQSLHELRTERAKRKAVYIPHIHYINAYNNSGKFPLIELDSSNRIIYLFLGMLRPYKNIELLISAFKEIALPNSHLVIAGKPFNDEYKYSIESMCSGIHNITLDLRFIPDSEMPDYLESTDVLVLPYNKTSSMNSGTMIMAFSYRCPVIIPDIPMAKDWDGTNTCFMYTYTADNHKEKLKEAMVSAYNAGKDGLKLMGENGFNIVQSTHDYVTLTRDVDTMLERL